MDFAPYQSSPPEHVRAFSPPQDSISPRTSLDAHVRANPWAPRASQASPPPLHHPQPQRAWSGDGIQSREGYQSPLAGFGGGMGDYFSGLGAREGMVSEFDTTLGLRLDYEACLAYLAVPPIGAILLLILEHKSDYVRFHAWQSSLLFTILFVVHLFFSWSTVLTWLLALGDIGLIAFLTLQAYKDADTLDRFRIPIVGDIATRFVDDE
ncbi:UPF0132 domain protein [Thozetella sp. PMI_491]|nr:UPF0132 domain protein [Thozetella sp. PMI_491]